MKYVEAAGATLSAIGLGSWQFGSREWGYGRDYVDARRPDRRRALDLGVNLIDTAEIYGFGTSERIVGRAIGAGATRRSWRPRSCRCCRWRRSSCSGAGQRRPPAVDTIDLYQVHQANPFVPVARRWTGCASCRATV